MAIEVHPRDLKVGDDARRNWQTINALRKETERIASDLRNATTAIAELRAKVGWKDPGGGVVQRMVVYNIYANYLVCIPYVADGGPPSGGTKLVAIPFFLRASTYEDLTTGGFHWVTTAGQIRRSLAASPADYTVRIFAPTYDLGQDIYAFQPAGKTDVVIQGTRVTWMDANVEGRRLDTDQVKLTVCQFEGTVAVNRSVVVEGGPIY